MLKSMVLLGHPPFFWTLETNCNAKAGIPMAPTIFAFKGKRTPAKLLKEIKVRISWWKNHHFLLGESWIVVLHDPHWPPIYRVIFREETSESLSDCDPRQGAGKASSWSNPWWHFHWDSVARQQSVWPGGVLAVTLNIFYKIRSFPTFSIFCTLGSISCTWLTLIEASEANCPSRSARRTKPISNCTPLTHMIWVLCPRTCDKLWQDPSILKKYFKEYAECPEYVVQASVSQGFCVNKLQITGRCCRSALMALLEIGRLAFSGSMVSFCTSALQSSQRSGLVDLLLYGYGSIPINTIFNGMNIHLPAILMWTTGVQGFDTLPYVVIFAQVCNCQQGSRFNRGLRAWDSLAIVTWPKVPEFLLFPRMAQRSLSQACNNFRDDSGHFVGFCGQVMTSQRSSLRTRNGLGRKPSRPVTSGDL